jgi:uncharacterized membrane protein
MQFLNMGAYHPLFVHFPIVLFVLALLCAFLSPATKEKTLFLDMRLKQLFFSLTHVFVICATIALIPTVATGWVAASFYPASEGVVSTHRNLAIFAALVSLVQSLVRIYLIQIGSAFPRPVMRNRLLALLLFNTVLVMWAADYGGLITRGETPFQSLSGAQQRIRRYRDPLAVHKMPSAELEKYLGAQVGVEDVMPLFEKYGCIKCHQSQFAEGRPSNFSKAVEKNSPIWLPRHANGELDQWEKSPFYITVILKNRMPYDQEGNSVGMAIKDRLTMLEWLKNGAPSKEPLVEKEEEE